MNTHPLIFSVVRHSLPYYDDHNNEFTKLLSSTLEKNSAMGESAFELYCLLTDQTLHPMTVDEESCCHHFWAIENHSQKVIGILIIVCSLTNKLFQNILVSVLVDEEKRRHKVGSTLIDQAIVEMKRDNQQLLIPAQAIDAFVPASSSVTRFFERCGFQRRSGVPGFSHLQFPLHTETKKTFWEILHSH